MTFFMKNLRLFLFSMTLLLALPQQMYAQKKAYIKAYYTSLVDKDGTVIDEKSSKPAPYSKYVYFNKALVRVDDASGSVYRLVSEPQNRDNASCTVNRWNAVDESGDACDVGLYTDKKTNNVFFFVEYQRSDETLRSYYYFLASD